MMQAKNYIHLLLIFFLCGLISCQKETPTYDNLPVGPKIGQDSILVSLISYHQKSQLFLCGNHLRLYAGGGYWKNYLWTPGGDTTEIIEVPYDTAGGSKMYIVQVEGTYDIYIDSIEIIFQDFLMRFPDSFTPDFDGKNDFFFAFYGGCFNQIDYTMEVFEPETGATVYESNNITASWSGSHNGKDMPMGYYPYHYNAIVDGVKHEGDGQIFLLR